jgi:hypothetical protein
VIVTAYLDLSEGGHKPSRPEGPTPVLIFNGDNQDLDAALAAIAKCQLIRQGHVFRTEIAHSANYEPFYDWRMDEDGGVFR